jgi:LacI family transcriptional regulator
VARQAQGPRRPTLQDIAEAVGVTANTVSRALNDMPGVSPATREHIKAEADRIGYVPNANARSLVHGSRKAIGVIITDLANPVFADLLSEIEARAIGAGYTVLVFLSDESPEREQLAVEAALRSGVDGIIAAPVQGRSNPWGAVLRAGIPLVAAAREIPEPNVDVVANDNEEGMRQATNVLLDLGAQDVVLIEEDLPITTVTHRIAGFRRALEEHNVRYDLDRTAFISLRHSPRAAMLGRAEEAYRLSCDLLDHGRRPDAFVVGNDYFALGLYHALKERGLRIPDDIMVMGWGDYPFSRYLDPPLSTLSMPNQEVARRASRLLLARLEGTGPAGPVAEYLRPKLALRASTGHGTTTATTTAGSRQPEGASR